MNTRRVPDTPTKAWSPPTYRVDGSGKVVGAEPGTPNNWGRWGTQDQLGCANLITPESVKRGAATIRTGRRYSLGLPIGGPPTGAVPPAVTYRTATSADAIVDPPTGHPAYSDEVLVMGTQSYTQLDGLAHVAADDTLYNGYWSGLVTGARGAARLGMHGVIDGIVGRGVLVDVARHLGVDVVPPHIRIDVEVLEDALRACRSSLAPGDVLLVRTGILGAWDGRAGSMGMAPQSGLHESVAGWLGDHDIALLGADNSAVEALDASSGGWNIPLHVAALRDLGLYLAELLWLDDLAAACAADGVYDFLFVAMPLPIIGAVGSPLNPVAIR